MNWRSTKFQLAVACFAVSAAALFMDKIAGGEWIACVTLITGIYASADVAQKRIK